MKYIYLVELFSDVLRNQIDFEIRFSNGFSFGCPHFVAHTRSHHISLLTHSIYSRHCNGGNCKAISHFHYSLLLLLRKYHKSNYRLDWFYETFGWVSTMVRYDENTSGKNAPSRSHTPTRIHQKWYDEKRIWDMRYGRPLAVVLMLSPSSHTTISLWVSNSIEACSSFSRRNNRNAQPIHKIRIKIHFEFDWIHIFHSNPIVPIRYRRFLFVVYLSACLSLCATCSRGMGLTVWSDLSFLPSVHAHTSHQFGFYANENSRNNLYFISIPRFLSPCSIANFVANTRAAERRGKMQYKTNDYFWFALYIILTLVVVYFVAGCTNETA